MMPAGSPITIAAFLMASSLVLLAFVVLGDRQARLKDRLRDLSGQGGPSSTDTITLGKIATTALPKMGAPFVPSDEEERTKLQTRMVHAGLYRREAMVIFLGVKTLLMTGPALLGIAAGFVGLVTVQEGLILGAC